MKEILITSSVLIAAILVLRRLFRTRVSQRLIYGAWLLVALRLLIPVQIGQIPFSLLSAAEPITEVMGEVSDIRVSGISEQEVYRQILQDYIEQDPGVFTQKVQEHIQHEIEANTSMEEIAARIDQVYSEQEIFDPQIQLQVQEEVATTPAPITLGQILIGIWIVGICGMATWFLTANLLFLARAKKGAFPLPIQDSKLPVRVSAHVPTPCLVGLFRPVIYLTPPCAEDPQIRGHVLAHEQAHWRHGDHIWALIRCLCLCIYWFNPLVWVAAAQSRRDCELACDESALKKLGEDQRIAYGKTLLDIVVLSMSPVHLLKTATAMNEAKKQLKERVRFIAKKRKNLVIVSISLLLSVVLATGCAFMGAAGTRTADSALSTTTLIHGSVTSPGYKRVYLLTDVANYSSSGTLTGWYNFTYDENGQLLTLKYSHPSNPTNNYQITYSRNDQGLISVITTESYKFGSSYDRNYNQVSLENYFNYTFDDEGRILGYQIAKDGNTRNVAFTYDYFGRLSMYKDDVYTHFSYDADGKLVKVATPDDRNGELYEFTFAYDDQGRLVTFTDSYRDLFTKAVLANYKYDDQGRLVQESNPRAQELTYVWENNVLTDIYCFNSQPYGSQQRYELDQFGNVTRIIQEDGSLTQFQYLATDLPDEYADRVLAWHRVVGPQNVPAAYCDNIVEYLMPYGNSKVQTWRHLS